MVLLVAPVPSPTRVSCPRHDTFRLLASLPFPSTPADDPPPKDAFVSYENCLVLDLMRLAGSVNESAQHVRTAPSANEGREPSTATHGPLAPPGSRHPPRQHLAPYPAPTAIFIRTRLGKGVNNAAPTPGGPRQSCALPSSFSAVTLNIYSWLKHFRGP